MWASAGARSTRARTMTGARCWMWRWPAPCMTSRPIRSWPPSSPGSSPPSIPNRRPKPERSKLMGNTSVVEKWVDEAAALTRPTKVTWADGSKQEYDRLVESMLRDSTLLELNQKTYPGCYLHRSHPQDVARTEQLTFICTRNKDDAGPTNNWMEPAEAKAKAGAYLKNSMKERQMWVIPYLMGPAGSA